MAKHLFTSWRHAFNIAKVIMVGIIGRHKSATVHLFQLMNCANTFATSKRESKKQHSLAKKSPPNLVGIQITYPANTLNKYFFTFSPFFIFPADYRGTKEFPMLQIGKHAMLLPQSFNMPLASLCIVPHYIDNMHCFSHTIRCIPWHNLNL